MSLKLQRDESGHIDLDVFGQGLSVKEFAVWIRSRCQGNDELWATDEDSQELPHEVFVDLWMRSIDDGPIRQCMDRACAVLVEEAWSTPVDAWALELIHLITIIRPASVQPFFNSSVVRFPAPKGQEVMLPWLQAAAAYPNQSAVLDVWKHLIEQDCYSQLAYFALCHDMEMAIQYLPRYYHSMRVDDRPFLLREALREIFDRNDVEARNLLASSSCRGRFADEEGLCEAVNVSLEELGRAPVFKNNKRTIFDPEAVSRANRPVYKLKLHEEHTQ